MYHMKSIVSLEDELFLPRCMYRLKNPIEYCITDETELNISDQVMKFLKKMPNTDLIELENRQDKLLIKLDSLYERIKNISTLCQLNVTQETKGTIKSDEIVIVLNANNLPWFLNKFLKTQPLNVSWHLHSSIDTEKIPKIGAFFRKYKDLYIVQQDAKIDLRLIFKCDSTAPELKISSLAVPILGTVNIIRYLCLTYKKNVPYDYCDHKVDALLDLCYQLEKGLEKNRALLISKIFVQCNEWIYQDKFSIVDLAVFNAINQWQNGIKYVPKKWLNNCEMLLL